VKTASKKAKFWPQSLNRVRIHAMFSQLTSVSQSRKAPRFPEISQGQSIAL
jgi:hypothetical protein